MHSVSREIECRSVRVLGASDQLTIVYDENGLSVATVDEAGAVTDLTQRGWTDGESD
jgi:hypothetical protein